MRKKNKAGSWDVRTIRVVREDFTKKCKYLTEEYVQQIQKPRVVSYLYIGRKVFDTN